jgi:hypothetical protein
VNDAAWAPLIILAVSVLVVVVVYVLVRRRL